MTGRQGRQMQKKVQGAAWVLMIVLGGYILYKGLAIAKENHFLKKLPFLSGVETTLEAMAVKTHMPALSFMWQGTDHPKKWTDLAIDEILPLYSYAMDEADGMPDIESRLEYELMMELESQTEALAEWTEDGENQEELAKEEGLGEQAGAGSEADTGSGDSTENAEDGTDTEIRTGEGSGQSAGNPEGAGDKADAGSAEGAGDKAGTGDQADAEDKAGAGNPEGETGRVKAKDPKRAPLAVFDENELRDYDYLLNHFFAVDPSTTPMESQINYDLLMSKDLKLTGDSSKPQILIYHTHSQEAFIDSKEGDVNDTIVGVGNYLTELLEDTYGYHVIHHTEVYDLVDGVLDRNKAYTLAAPDIQQILDENPSIEVVIDLHRDGVDGYKFVTDIDGKPTAQIMFYNGLSRSAESGEIDYLPNPYIEDNLAFSFQLQLKANEYYPGWTRNIYLSSLRYNLHMSPKSLLIESGTQLNTVQEELNSMELLADILNQVLRGK